jgi:hypothetical protein
VSADPRHAALAALARELQALLTAFDAAHDDGATTRAAHARVTRAFERFRKLHEEHGQGRALPAELREPAAEVLRLHAVATSLAARARETLAAELDELGRARRQLRSLERSASAATTGGSCDVRG